VGILPHKFGSVKWKNPLQSWYKINWDVAIDSSNGRIGVCFSRNCDSGSDSCLSYIVFEGDSLQVVNALKEEG
jgi:hypothetical protein